MPTQTLTQILTTARVTTTSNAASSSKSPQHAPALQTRYGDAAALLATFNPDEQYALATRPEQAYTGQALTLAAVSRDYGENVAEAWLEIQVHDLAKFAGVRDKLTNQQSRATAKAILATSHYLNLNELLLFFFKFKAGEYGRFYGQIDPLVITNALQDFKRDRRDALFTIESQRAATERAKRSTGAVSREEYEKLKARAARGDTEALKQLKPPQQ